MTDVGQAHLESQSFQICPSYSIGPIWNLPLTWNCIPNRVALALNIALVWSSTLHRIDLHLYDDYADVTHCDGIYLSPFFASLSGAYIRLKFLSGNTLVWLMPVR